METEWKHLGGSFKLIPDSAGNLQGIRGFNGTTPSLWTLQGATRTIQRQFTHAAESAGTALTRISNQIIPSCVTQERDPLQRWMAALESSFNSVREARLLWESFNDDEDKSVTLISYLDDLVQLSVNLCELLHDKTESFYDIENHSNNVEADQNHSAAEGEEQKRKPETLLELNERRNEFRIKEKWHEFKGDYAARFLSALMTADGEWQAGKQLLPRASKPDRVYRNLPEAIRDIIEHRRGQGGGYRINPKYLRMEQ